MTNNIIYHAIHLRTFTLPKQQEATGLISPVQIVFYNPTKKIKTELFKIAILENTGRQKPQEVFGTLYKSESVSLNVYLNSPIAE